MRSNGIGEYKIHSTHKLYIIYLIISLNTTSYFPHLSLVMMRHTTLTLLRIANEISSFKRKKYFY